MRARQTASASVEHSRVAKPVAARTLVVRLAKVWPPMLATLATPEAVGSDARVLEVKYDGFRVVAAVRDGAVMLRSRNDKDVSARFPRVVAALASLGIRDAVIDGEVIAMDAKGVSRFQLLQTPGEHPERFAAFDLLWHDGEDLRAKSLTERRSQLEALLASASAGASGAVMLSERVRGSLEKALARARTRGMEGLIAKDPDAPYTGGRSARWLKVKVHASQEVVILGYLPISNGTDGIGALVAGVHDETGFREAGKIGTGFTSAMRASLKQLLDRDVRKTPAAADAKSWKGVVWVTPKHVANVTFAEWTRDGRMRQPVFQGLRSDKRAVDVVREKPVERVAAERVAKSAKPVAKSLKAEPAVKAPKRTARKNAGEDAYEQLLTHPDRVLFPSDGYTKRDVFEYYRAVAPVLVPILAHRPLALQAWTSGIDAPGFFRQGLVHVPDWVPRLRVEHEGRTLEHLDADRPEALLWAANQSILTLHMWCSHAPTLDVPDWVTFDLDPGGERFADVLPVAAALRAELEALGLESVPKTSGKRGLHVVVPIAPGHTYAQAMAFAERLMKRVEIRLPKTTTQVRAKAARGAKLYLDAGQNARGRTLVAPYSVRARPGAPVSAPLVWAEVNAKLDPLQFTIRTMPERVDAKGDLFARAMAGGQTLPAIG